MGRPTMSSEAPAENETAASSEVAVHVDTNAEAPAKTSEAPASGVGAAKQSPTPPVTEQKSAMTATPAAENTTPADKKDDDAPADEKQHRKSSGLLLIWQLLMVLFICLFTKYDDGLFSASVSGPQMLTYGHFQDVHVMIFIGFGFLMTFLRKYGASAVSLNMLVAVFCIEWYIIGGGFVHKLCEGGDALENKITVNLVTLITADFAAACVLITFGGLLGKVSFQQLMVVTFFEILFFSFNESLNSQSLIISDMGGSVVLHTFGAYFGLGASWVLTTKEAKEHVDNSSSRTSDLFSMIGTIFLWMFWPSFNSALAPAIEQQRCVVNTVISITGSCVMAFIVSYYMRGGKFNMVDVQNATLAGGVAIGTACNMAVTPGGALCVGCIAGILSVVGYTKISPWLESTLGLYDTCGIHNLHGMPGVLAGIVGAIAAAAATEDDYKGLTGLKAAFPGRYDEAGNEVRTAGEQGWCQFGYLIATLAISICSGILTGYIALYAARPATKLFDDSESFEVPDEEIPEWAQAASPTSHMIRRKVGSGDKEFNLDLNAAEP